MQLRSIRSKKLDPGVPTLEFQGETSGLIYRVEMGKVSKPLFRVVSFAFSFHCRYSLHDGIDSFWSSGFYSNEFTSELTIEASWVNDTVRLLFPRCLFMYRQSKQTPSSLILKELIISILRTTALVFLHGVTFAKKIMFGYLRSKFLISRQVCYEFEHSMHLKKFNWSSCKKIKREKDRVSSRLFSFLFPQFR